VHSKTPPCPGSNFPESLTFKLLLKSDSNKSPSTEAMATSNAEIIQKSIAEPVLSAIRNPANPVNNTPITVPSHVFFGEILGNRDLFPIHLPPR
jgi:hypothetical protein